MKKSILQHFQNTFSIISDVSNVR